MLNCQGTEGGGGEEKGSRRSGVPSSTGPAWPTSLSVSRVVIHALPIRLLTSCLPFQVFSLVDQISESWFCLRLTYGIKSRRKGVPPLRSR